MSSILNSPDILAALRQRKKVTGRKLKASRTRIVEGARQLWTPLPKATSKAEGISRLIANGLVIYNGLRIFTKVYSAVRTIFGHRKLRR